jgi:hypothetical protein
VADDPSWQARTGTGFDKSQFLARLSETALSARTGYVRKSLPSLG